MKYVKLKDFTGTLNEGEILLMSKKEFDEGGKEITDIPICVTPTGDEPIENKNQYENSTINI